MSFSNYVMELIEIHNHHINKCFLKQGVLPDGKTVAVKNLLSMSQLQERQFKNEVENLMRVRHTNVVRFLGYCCETRQKYTKYKGINVFAETPKRLLCFEYMTNGSLEKYISGMTIQHA